MQGFLFSPAVPGDDFPALVRASHSDTHWRLPSNRMDAPAAELTGALLHSSLKRGLAWPATPAGPDGGPELVRARSA
jgi:hypothetical protein